MPRSPTRNSVSRLQALLPPSVDEKLSSSQILTPDPIFTVRYLLENLNKRLTLGGAREGLKDIVGKKFPNATTFEQYREALFKNVTTGESTLSKVVAAVFPFLP